MTDQQQTEQQPIDLLWLPPESTVTSTTNMVQSNALVASTHSQATTASSSTTQSIPAETAIALPLSTAAKPGQPVASTKKKAKKKIVVDPNAPTWGAQKFPEENLRRMKDRRKKKQVAVGAVSAAAGLVILGPLGLVLGGVAGAAATKASAKRKEKNKIRKYHKDTVAARKTKTRGSILAHTASVA